MKKLTVLFAVLVLSSCATIINGPYQKVPIASTPSGADVLINENIVGKTPIVVRLKRSKTYESVQLKLEGYVPHKFAFVKKVDPIILGNIIIGGVIGLFIDMSSGNMYMFLPENVDITLIPEQ